MYRELRQLIAWPERERLYETMPASFKKYYFHLITVLKSSLRSQLRLRQDLPHTVSTRNTTLLKY